MTLLKNTTSFSSCSYSFSHPKNNLPSIKLGNEPEVLFTESFMDSYLNNVKKLHSKTTKTEMLLAREIPIHGLGIADLLSVS